MICGVLVFVFLGLFLLYIICISFSDFLERKDLG